MHNLLLSTDFYKMTHWKMYPKNTEYVYSYFEARKGAKFDKTTFFGLNWILKRYFNKVTMQDVNEANEVCKLMLGQDGFNYEGWKYIVKKYNGNLPLRIKAVPEGLSVPINNVLMTVENTDPNCAWLTNYMETLLTHVWYPSTVCSLSRSTKESLIKYAELTCDNNNHVNFQLHDFGARACTTTEAAAIGGLAHLVNFLGTDTLPAIMAGRDYYDADINGLCFSVNATEHSVQSALGQEGEEEVVGNLLENYPTGILSVVGDTYCILNFVDNIVGVKFKEQILKRDGVFVVRPDSNLPEFPTPEKQVVRLISSLWNNFGGTTNTKGFKVLDTHIRLIYGDGIDKEGIQLILEELKNAGFSSENIVFGMGGGLLQKINRDVQKFAFKASSQCRGGTFFDVYKRPRDVTKESKRGKLKLVMDCGTLITVPESDPRPDVMQTVYENGEILISPTFAEIRKRASL